MRHLRLVSLVMTATGLAAVAAAVVLDWGAVWMLTGLLLMWAGIVKVIVVVLWGGVARLEGPGRSPGDDV